MRATDLLPAICDAHFPGQGAPTEILRPRTGKFNETVFFSLGGQDLVLRLAPSAAAGFLFYERGMMAQEPEIHARVRAETSVPVPRILVHDDTRTLAPEPFLILERLPGVPLTAAGGADTDAVFRQVGQFLGELHRTLTAASYGYLGAHRPMEPASTWGEAFAVMWHKLIDDIVACGGYDAGQAERMRRMFARDRAVFDRPVRASLLHMDVWHQNILVDARGNVSGLVDWDRALWGDPEIEFAVLDYCGVSVPSFWDGYGAERDTAPEANLRGVYYYLYELQKYIVIRTLRGRDPLHAQNYVLQAQRLARQLE